jgi:tRNA(Arg) A34 adenosine deaminase TadA
MSYLPDHDAFIHEAVALSKRALTEGEGGPFGCVIVKDGEIIGRGWNQVLTLNDPTAHAEVMAIRQACANLKSFQLDGCILYTSCEPCPMCLGAIYWARPDAVYFANTHEDAAAIGFDDDFIYHELKIPMPERSIPMSGLDKEEALKVFEAWDRMERKPVY